MLAGITEDWLNSPSTWGVLRSDQTGRIETSWMEVVRSSPQGRLIARFRNDDEKTPFAKRIGMLTQGPNTLASGREAGKTRIIRLLL
jgi:hypothetical protein